MLLVWFGEQDGVLKITSSHIPGLDSSNGSLCVAVVMEASLTRNSVVAFKKKKRNFNSVIKTLLMLRRSDSSQNITGFPRLLRRCGRMPGAV